MSANFYNNRGIMVGPDIHPWSALPQIWIATTLFDNLGATWSKRTTKVTSDAQKMLKGGFTVYAVPHIPTNAPVPPAPPAIALALAAVVLGASTKAHMKAHSVRAEGGALATCLWSAFGLNANCCFPIAMPFGVVTNVNSVQTSPSLGDYVAAYVEYVVTAATSYLASEMAKDLAGKIANEIWKFVFQQVVKYIYRFRKLIPVPLFNPLFEPTPIAEIVQRVVDGIAKSLR